MPSDLNAFWFIRLYDIYAGEDGYAADDLEEGDTLSQEHGREKHRHKGYDVMIYDRASNADRLHALIPEGKGDPAGDEGGEREGGPGPDRNGTPGLVQEFIAADRQEQHGSCRHAVRRDLECGIFFEKRPGLYGVKSPERGRADGEQVTGEVAAGEPEAAGPALDDKNDSAC